MHLSFQIMRWCNNLKVCTLISHHIMLFFLFIHNIAASDTTRELLAETLKDDPLNPCENVNCGQGTCVASSFSLLGFDCLCNSGWNKVQLGPIAFPACTVPNCTINYQCGSKAAPPPANSPPFDPLNPCNLVWCGDGTCVPNGLGYSCKCNDGSANLFNMTSGACLTECFIGADCKDVTFGSPVSPSPPPAVNAVGKPTSSSSPTPPPKNASSSVPDCGTSPGQVTMLLCCLIFLACTYTG